jgi:release factor glutamine methyltransferase
MILRQALQSAARTLRQAEIPDASIEAELLLGHVLNMSRTQLYTEPERRLTSRETERLNCLIGRRLGREPNAYILGHCEFYGIDLYVDCRALIPRPETELLVERAVELGHHIFCPGGQLLIADIGTGCGAIAVSLALALPQARIYASDISGPALRLAEVNCHRYAVGNRVHLLQGDLLQPLPEPVDMVVANLPYVRREEFQSLSPEIKDFEPAIALTGGEDGLDKIRQLLEQLPAKLRPGGGLLLEIGWGQGETVASLVDSCLPGASMELITDMGGVDRVVQIITQEPGQRRAR